MEPEWKWIFDGSSWRNFNEEGHQFGEIFQAAVRSPEWKSSLIVYEKYKRKYNLEYKNLVDLCQYVVNFSEERKAQGKKCSSDYLTQIASAELKFRGGVAK